MPYLEAVSPGQGAPVHQIWPCRRSAAPRLARAASAAELSRPRQRCRPCFLVRARSPWPMQRNCATLLSRRHHPIGTGGAEPRAEVESLLGDRRNASPGSSSQSVRGERAAPAHQAEFHRQRLRVRWLCASTRRRTMNATALMRSIEQACDAQAGRRPRSQAGEAALSFRVRMSREAQDDLERLFFSLARARCPVHDLELPADTFDDIRGRRRRLKTSPFTCRKAGKSPLLRELIIPFGRAGYVALFRDCRSDRSCGVGGAASARGRLPLIVWRLHRGRHGLQRMQSRSITELRSYPRCGDDLGVEHGHLRTMPAFASDRLQACEDRVAFD